MDVIFNDFSIDEQFNNIEEFVDSLCNNTLPAMCCLEKVDAFLLLKSKKIFERNICPEVNFGYFLNYRSFGFPELIKFKIMLVQILDEPYWEDYALTDVESVYNCSALGVSTGDNPTCFSEALERNAPLMSFQHSAFSNLTISIEKHQKNCLVSNVFNKESVCEFLLTRGLIGFSEYILRKNYLLNVIFLCDNKQHYFADSCFENDEITIDDFKGIAETFERHIDQLYNGIASKLTKSITHKNITYFEFRDKLSHDREFRIFYYRKGNELFYLNSLLKKTQSTPTLIKDYSVRLIKENLI